MRPRWAEERCGQLDGKKESRPGRLSIVQRMQQAWNRSIQAVSRDRGFIQGQGCLREELREAQCRPDDQDKRRDGMNPPTGVLGVGRSSGHAEHGRSVHAIDSAGIPDADPRPSPSQAGESRHEIYLSHRCAP